MSTIKIIRELFTIAFGVLGIALVVAWDAEWYYALLGVVLIAWGSWDIYKELRAKQSGSAVDQSAGARAEIEARMQGGEAPAADPALSADAASAAAGADAAIPAAGADAATAAPGAEPVQVAAELAPAEAPTTPAPPAEDAPAPTKEV